MKNIALSIDDALLQADRELRERRSASGPVRVVSARTPVPESQTVIDLLPDRAERQFSPLRDIHRRSVPSIVREWE